MISNIEDSFDSIWSLGGKFSCSGIEHWTYRINSTLKYIARAHPQVLFIGHFRRGTHRTVWVQDCPDPDCTKPYRDIWETGTVKLGSILVWSLLIYMHILNLLFEQIQKHLKLRNWVLRNIQWCLQLLDIWTLNLCISFAMNHSDYFFLCLLCLISYQQELLVDFYTPKIRWISIKNCPVLSI